MSHGAQCLFCQHARRDTSKPLTRATIGKTRLPVVIGCDRFAASSLGFGKAELSATIAEMQSVLAALLYQNAGHARCPAHKRIELHKDAYFAQDADPVGDLIKERDRWT